MRRKKIFCLRYCISPFIGFWHLLMLACSDLFVSILLTMLLFIPGVIHACIIIQRQPRHIMVWELEAIFLNKQINKYLWLFFFLMTVLIIPGVVHAYITIQHQPRHIMVWELEAILREESMLIWKIIIFFQTTVARRHSNLKSRPWPWWFEI